MTAKSLSHNSGKKGKPKGNLRHNNRDFISKNIDKDRIADNIIIKQQSLSDAYKHCFDEATQKYNAKQKRADRKINDYFEKTFGKKADTLSAQNIIVNPNDQHSFYEDVIGIGNKDDTPCGSEDAQVATEIMQMYITGGEVQTADGNIIKFSSFQERNPNLYLFNAVIHLDEKTPHAHLDYIPVAHGYKKSLDTQNGRDRALIEMGYKGERKTLIDQWRKAERAVLKEIAEAYGVEIREPEKSRGVTLTPREYKDLKDSLKPQIIEEYNEEVQNLSEQKAELSSEIDNLIEMQETETDTLTELQDKALAYEQPPKIPLERKQAYEVRVATGQQATAILQREQSSIDIHSKLEAERAKFNADKAKAQSELESKRAELNAQKQRVEQKEKIVNTQKQQLDFDKIRQDKIVALEARRQVEEILDNNGIQLPNNLLNEQMMAHRVVERTIDNDSKSKNNVTQQRL